MPAKDDGYVDDDILSRASSLASGSRQGSEYGGGSARQQYSARSGGSGGGSRQYSQTPRSGSDTGAGALRSDRSGGAYSATPRSGGSGGSGSQGPSRSQSGAGYTGRSGQTGGSPRGSEEKYSEGGYYSDEGGGGGGGDGEGSERQYSEYSNGGGGGDGGGSERQYSEYGAYSGYSDGGGKGGGDGAYDGSYKDDGYDGGSAYKENGGEPQPSDRSKRSGEAYSEGAYSEGAYSGYSDGGKKSGEYTESPRRSGTGGSGTKYSEGTGAKYESSYKYSEGDPKYSYGEYGDGGYSEANYSAYSGYSGSAYDGKYSAYDGYSEGYDGSYKYDGEYGSYGYDGYSKYDGSYRYDDGSGTYKEGTGTQRSSASAEALAVGGHGAGLDDLAVIPEADDGSHVGLGIQLQEPETRAEGGTGFKVTRLVRGAPGDACGLICEGDVLTAIDHASILFFSFAEVSKALSGREGTAVTLGFERVVRERGALRTRAFEIALRRERFLVADDDAGADGGDGDDDALSLASAREGAVATKADYWEGYRAAMAQKAPALAGSILSFDGSGSDGGSEAGELPEVPPSPSGSEGGSDVEAHTEARLSAALAAGQVEGLPGPGALRPQAEVEAEERQLAEEEAADAAEEAALLSQLGATSRQWAEKFGRWDGAMRKAHEGSTVKAELLQMWRLKLTALRSKLGTDNDTINAQVDQLAAADFPPPRGGAQGARAAAVLEAVQKAGDAKQAPTELLSELQRQMVEAERWRAQTRKMEALLKKAKAELGRKVRRRDRPASKIPLPPPSEPHPSPLRRRRSSSRCARRTSRGRPTTRRSGRRRASRRPSSASPRRRTPPSRPRRRCGRSARTSCRRR